jgi:hypothetical protein
MDNEWSQIENIDFHDYFLFSFAKRFESQFSGNSQSCADFLIEPKFTLGKVTFPTSGF